MILFILTIVDLPISLSLNILAIYKFMLIDNSTNIFVYKAFYCVELSWLIYLNWYNYQESCEFFRFFSNVKPTNISIFIFLTFVFIPWL